MAADQNFNQLRNVGANRASDNDMATRHVAWTENIMEVDHAGNSTRASSIFPPPPITTDMNERNIGT